MKSFSYTPDASFSQEFEPTKEMRKGRKEKGQIGPSNCCERGGYTPDVSFSEECLLHS